MRVDVNEMILLINYLQITTNDISLV